MYHKMGQFITNTKTTTSIGQMMCKTFKEEKL